MEEDIAELARAFEGAYGEPIVGLTKDEIVALARQFDTRATRSKAQAAWLLLIANTMDPIAEEEE